MEFTKRQTLALLGGAATAVALPGLAQAEDGPTVHEVLMYNKHPENKKMRNVFVPDIVRAKPGDTIKFITKDKGHNAQSDKNMMPEGAEDFKSKISGDYELTVTAEGAYGYFCTPHRTLGMVGLILVGDVSGNYEDVKKAKQKGKAKKVYKDIFKRADAMLAAEKG